MYKVLFIIIVVILKFVIITIVSIMVYFCSRYYETYSFVSLFKGANDFFVINLYSHYINVKFISDFNVYL